MPCHVNLSGLNTNIQTIIVVVSFADQNRRLISIFMVVSAFVASVCHVTNCDTNYAILCSFVHLGAVATH